ncbi:MAG: glycoside hydrolase family 78 protein [candidate division KSB1 bacterium]|nr:glycoside hydrolase family 78 protein [candidate division KSB1 bacterium]
MRIAAASDLRCEYLVNPIGIDVREPRFSWVLEPVRRGQRQVAYQLIVCSKGEQAGRGVGDVWDSGRRESEQTCHVTYAGPPLESRQRYFWRIRWWDDEGRASPWSEIAFFEMGLQPEDWQGQWIGRKDNEEFSTRMPQLFGQELSAGVHARPVYFRKEFRLPCGARQARVYVCGLGYYELRLNGEKVGDRVLDPPQTDYHKLALYSTYDITDLTGEENAFGIILGNGRHIKAFGFGPPRFILQAHFWLEDGSEMVVVSDPSWRTAYGPLVEDGMYHGERYDARLEMPGWDQPGFADRSWEPGVVVDGPALAAQMMPPIRVTATIRPHRVYSPEPGVYVYDFGQNFTGWARLRVRGPRGTEVRMRYAELVSPDGKINTAPNQNAEATDVYVLKGEGIECYEPRFTYHGFRYVEVKGFPGAPTLEDLEGRVVHSDVPRTGEFHCSHELLNQIHRNILWGQLSNLMSIPTDCPQRDERHGWMGDAHLSAEEAILNFDMAGFYTNFLRSIRLAQKEDGSVPDIVPPYLPMAYPADPAWGSAYNIIGWYLYQYYGDLRVLEAHYEGMKAYVEFLRSNADGHIIRGLGKYGDWCPPGSIFPKKTGLDLTSTWYYYFDVVLLSRMAKVLGRKEDAADYAELASRVREAFNKEFLEGEQYQAKRLSRIDTLPNQTSNVLPLFLDMPPADKKQAVVGKLVHGIVNEHDSHLDTGILGTCYLLDVLTDNGYAELAYTIATQESYPSWGYMVREGATTLWERWEKLESKGMNSQNHIMLGSVDAWFYRAVAGLRCAAPGWRRIIVKPHLFPGLHFATARVQTILGRAEVSWEPQGEALLLRVHIPVGAEADVYLPVFGQKPTVTEGRNPVVKRGSTVGRLPEGVQVEQLDSERVRLRVLSGTYVFRSLP